jgi:RHS repeat-associated protein
MRTTYNAGVEGSLTSLPFGDGYAVNWADYDANHYAQLDHDTESGTDHAQFRQYSNAQGRWLSPDPYSGSYEGSDPQSFNRYAYVTNGPLAATDSQGLEKMVCIQCIQLGLSYPGEYGPVGSTWYFGGGSWVWQSEWEWAKALYDGITLWPDGSVGPGLMVDGGKWVDVGQYVYVPAVPTVASNAPNNAPTPQPRTKANPTMSHCDGVQLIGKSLAGLGTINAAAGGLVALTGIGAPVGAILGGIGAAEAIVGTGIWFYGAVYCPLS